VAGDDCPGLAQLRARAAPAGVLLDFDGTLAPIVVDPSHARPLPGSLSVLRALVHRFRLVAVISGRPAWFLAEHLPVQGLARLGSYGLERVTPDGVEASPEAARWRPVVAELADLARRVAPAGAGIEDKGLGLTLHHRAAHETEEWARAFAEREAVARGLDVNAARQSVELRPPVAVDKGTSAAELIADAGLEAACAAGDDTGDLPAFDAVARLPLSVRVAVRSDEAPPELMAAADLVVDGPASLLAVLRYLAG
jgi:trehalose 6-phosphate phosphatase